MRGLVVLALVVAVAGCASPQPTPAPTPAPTPTPTPTATPSPELVCPPSQANGPTPPPAVCAAEEEAASAAVAGFGYPVARIEILPNGWGCGPFVGPMACLVVRRGPTAYVYFAGTDEVAALEFVSTAPHGPLSARIVAWQPPLTSPAPTN